MSHTKDLQCEFINKGITGRTGRGVSWEELVTNSSPNDIKSIKKSHQIWVAPFREDFCDKFIYQTNSAEKEPLALLCHWTCRAVCPVKLSTEKLQRVCWAIHTQLCACCCWETRFSSLLRGKILWDLALHSSHQGDKRQVKSPFIRKVCGNHGHCVFLQKYKLRLAFFGLVCHFPSFPESASILLGKEMKTCQCGSHRGHNC